MPPDLAPIVFNPHALEQRVKCRNFYFDLSLLQDYWISRKYHHTMSSTLVAALDEALTLVEAEGLEARWARHERNHRAFVAGLKEMGLSMLPVESDRLWTVNTIRVPEGIDEARVRRQLLEEFSIEVGFGFGPLAGKIWRVGLMGASSTPRLIVLLLGALEKSLRAQGSRVRAQGPGVWV